MDNTSLSPPKSVDSGPILQKTMCVGGERGKPLFLYPTLIFLFSWLREHLSSPCRALSHLLLTKDTEWEPQTLTSNVTHQKCAVEWGCCLPALDISSIRGFFSSPTYLVLCSTGKEMQCMLQGKLIQFPTLTQTNLKEKSPLEPPRRKVTIIGAKNPDATRNTQYIFLMTPLTLTILLCSSLLAVKFRLKVREN